MPPKTVSKPSTVNKKEEKKWKGEPNPEVTKWVRRALDMGVEKLKEEYKLLSKYTLPEMTTNAFNDNNDAGKNRYQDVPCQDQCRVSIKIPNFPVEYIHANYVSTPQSDKRFICTQGPLAYTISEFWVMVLQENANIIIMLCNTVEKGKDKCAQYWPEKEGDTLKCDGCTIEVTNMRITVLPQEPSVKKTIIRVKWIGGQRDILHYQWMDWPDRGVPPTRLTAMELLICVRGCRTPIVVHCSAGIGRTGTIVAIEYILERMAAKEECAAMNELLMMLRNQRAYSIQNDMQYLFVHRVMLCYFIQKHDEMYGFILKEGDNKAKYDKFVADYTAFTGCS